MTSQPKRQKETAQPTNEEWGVSKKKKKEGFLFHTLLLFHFSFVFFILFPFFTPFCCFFFSFFLSPLPPSWLATLVDRGGLPLTFLVGSSPFLDGHHFWLGGLPFSLFVGKKRKKKRIKEKKEEKEKRNEEKHIYEKKENKSKKEKKRETNNKT